MTTFNGHGPASPAIVSTSMATRMMTSHTRYGRARSMTRPAMPAPDLFEAEAVDITALRLALMVDDLVTLPLEGGDPFVDRRGPKAGTMRIATPTLNAGGLEEVVQLLVGQLDQPIGEK